VDGASTDAKWIWSEEPVSDWTVNKISTFERTFTVSDAVTSATLTLAADNSYNVYLDGNFIGGNISGNFNSATGDSIAIPSLSVGQHSLKFVVKNLAQEGDAVNNPGGLLFKLALNNTTCTPVVNPPHQNSAPTIQLLGDSAITLTIGSVFVDPGARGMDAEDLPASFVDYPTTTAGFTVTGAPAFGPLLIANAYTINYKFCDSGNPSLCSAEVTRIVTVVPGNTQCSDGLDNDNDEFRDSNDSGCHSDGNVSNSGSYVPGDDSESTVVVPPVCSENQTLVENVCVTNESPVIPPTIVVNPPTGGNPGGSGGHRRGGNGGGRVLGASTECGIYIGEYIKLGAKNNPEEVNKLQSFLNEWTGASLKVTGIYDQATFNAVKAFQLKYSSDILNPWIKIGLHKNDKTATGYVYKTTQRMINNLVCPALGLEIPDLSSETR
jgi:hypothetical protein